MWVGAFVRLVDRLESLGDTGKMVCCDALMCTEANMRVEL